MNQINAEKNKIFLLKHLEPGLQENITTGPEGSTLASNDELKADREKIIHYIKTYIKKNNVVPQTLQEFYKFVKLIGKGAFGKVTLGIHKLSGKQVAIKTFDKSAMKNEQSRQKVFREVFILKKIRHAYVIRLLEIFETNKYLLIVMEYVENGDLLQYVKKHKRLDEFEAKQIFRQITYGLGHIHAMGILHRDIKLDNILLGSENNVKICDFGVSKIMEKNTYIKEQCGTPAYLAPEIISEEAILI